MCGICCNYCVFCVKYYVCLVTTVVSALKWVVYVAATVFFFMLNVLCVVTTVFSALNWWFM